MLQIQWHIVTTIILPTFMFLNKAEGRKKSKYTFIVKLIYNLMFSSFVLVE